MIAGQTAENEEIEVVIDHDPPAELFSAYIQGPDNSPYWIAEDDAITYTIDGNIVSGSGAFRIGLGGQIPEGEPRELPGLFEIRFQEKGMPFKRPVRPVLVRRLVVVLEIGSVPHFENRNV